MRCERNGRRRKRPDRIGDSVIPCRLRSLRRAQREKQTSARMVGGGESRRWTERSWRQATSRDGLRGVGMTVRLPRGRSHLPDASLGVCRNRASTGYSCRGIASARPTRSRGSICPAPQRAEDSRRDPVLVPVESGGLDLLDHVAGDVRIWLHAGVSPSSRGGRVRGLLLGELRVSPKHASDIYIAAIAVIRRSVAPDRARG